MDGSVFTYLYCAVQKKNVLTVKTKTIRTNGTDSECDTRTPRNTGNLVGSWAVYIFPASDVYHDQVAPPIVSLLFVQNRFMYRFPRNTDNNIP